MPKGIAQAYPSGLWVQEPTTSSLPKLFSISACRFIGVAVIIYAIDAYRSINWNYSYKNFVGRTLIYGNFSDVDRKELSVEEIDKLRAEQAEKKVHGQI